MKIVIVGAGAMGSLFAFHLAHTEAEVWVYDVWAEHVNAIRSKGLQVRRGNEAFSASIHATTDPLEPGQADLVLVLVKHGQTYTALDQARPIIGPRTTILTLQNGIGNVETIRNMFGNQVLWGLTTLTCELLGPGSIEASYEGQGETYLWPLDGIVDDRVNAVYAVLARAGIAVSIAPDVELKVWKKLIVNCCLNTMCAITGLTVGKLIDQPGMWLVLESIVSEIIAVAEHEKISIPVHEAMHFLQSVANQARTHTPSMLIDIRKRQKTEISCLNGAVLDAGMRHGIATPLNSALHGLVHGIEASWSAPLPIAGNSMQNMN